MPEATGGIISGSIWSTGSGTTIGSGTAATGGDTGGAPAATAAGAGPGATGRCKLTVTVGESFPPFVVVRPVGGGSNKRGRLSSGDAGSPRKKPEDESR